MELAFFSALEHPCAWQSDIMCRKTSRWESDPHLWQCHNKIKLLDIDTLLLPFLSHIQCKLSLPSLHSFSLPEQSIEGCKPSPSIPQPRFCDVCRALTARQTAKRPQNPHCDMRQVTMPGCTSSSNRISHRRAVKTVVQKKKKKKIKCMSATSTRAVQRTAS